jgi:hypothetical protein
MSERLSMRKIRELLRLKHNGSSHRQIASSISVAVGTVCGQLQRAREAGVTWERAESITDAELEAMLFRDGGRNVAATRAAIDYGHVHSELHRDGVTLQLLWAEYVAEFYQVGLAVDHRFNETSFLNLFGGTSRSTSGRPHDTFVNYDNRDYDDPSIGTDLSTTARL